MRARRRVFTAVLIGAGVWCVAAVLPLPLYLICPGTAVDLSAAVTVGSRATPRERFFLTDVSVMRASPLRLAALMLPGVTVVRAETLGRGQPLGPRSAESIDDRMRNAMRRSQTVAAVVAERAAGLAGAPGGGAQVAAGARLAVPVRYAVGDIGGSSGGLMLALRIYDGLRATGRSRAGSFAGTGTISLDGRVGPIEGTRQKLIAAQRAGARIFFVPRANFADVAGERGIQVIPVDTFGQAVRALY